MRSRGLARLTRLDVPERLRAHFPELLTQILFALACTLGAIALRLLTDLWLTGAGPFALTVPAVLIATLFGRWQAGFITQTLSSLYAWYFVLPAQGSFDFVVAGDGPRVAVNMACGFFVVFLAELFRRAVRRAMTEREMLLLELEHRVKNNFASVAALLRLQLRDEPDPATRDALQTTLGRIESYSRANSFLYRGFDSSGTVNMKDYLRELCEALSQSLGSGQLRVECQAEDRHMPREWAITVGLLVNEVATNSVKHAFEEDGDGVIGVRFSAEPEGYRLIVRDNGRGMTESERSGSLGMKLIESLTQQAAGAVEIETGAGGTAFRFDFAR